MSSQSGGGLLDGEFYEKPSRVLVIDNAANSLKTVAIDSDDN